MSTPLVGLVMVASIGCASAGERGAAKVDAPPATNGDGDPITPGDDAAVPTACDMDLAGYATDFEGGDGGWSHVVLDGAQGQATWPFDDWQAGAATTGPGSCHGGGGCWATRLDANYTSCQRAALVSPAFDLSACAGRAVNLTLWSWHDFWTGVVSGSGTTWFDGGLIEVTTDGTTWSPVTPTPGYPGTIDINPNIGTYECVLSNAFHVDNKPGFVGNGGGWQRISVPIPANMITSGFRVRLAYGSGVSFANSDPEVDRQHTRAGWYIDDIAFGAP